MIAIPNMEKPKDCSNCSFYDSEYLWACEPLQNVDGYECPMVEIDLVRCRECKHKIQALSTEQGATSCELIRGTFYEDFFCKCGERRAE